MSRVANEQYISTSQILFDDRMFKFGQVWKISDVLIAIPDADRIQHGRKLHNNRYVVIVQNNEENTNELCPCITIAPLSSRIDLKRKYDIGLSPENDNVKQECMAKTSLQQPVLKKDLVEPLGEISEDKQAELMDALLHRLGLDLGINEVDEPIG